MHLSNNKNKTLIFIALYLTLLIGFYFGENTSGGAYDDFNVIRFQIIILFILEFLKLKLFNISNKCTNPPSLFIFVASIPSIIF